MEAICCLDCLRIRGLSTPMCPVCDGVSWASLTAILEDPHFDADTFLLVRSAYGERKHHERREPSIGQAIDRRRSAEEKLAFLVGLLPSRNGAA